MNGGRSLWCYYVELTGRDVVYSGPLEISRRPCSDILRNPAAVCKRAAKKKTNNPLLRRGPDQPFVRVTRAITQHTPIVIDSTPCWYTITSDIVTHRRSSVDACLRVHYIGAGIRSCKYLLQHAYVQCKCGRVHHCALASFLRSGRVIITAARVYTKYYCIISCRIHRRG